MSARRGNDELLDKLIDEWKAATPAPPAHLEDRVLRTIRAARRADEASAEGETVHRGGPRPVEDLGRGGEDRRRSAEIIPWYRPAAWPRPAWAAAGALAAMLAIASTMTIRAAFFLPAGPQQADRLLVADALREAEAAEREHARAIARLEEVARPILAKAGDPQLSGAQAARLAALGNRLRFLDQTIAEINDFLEQNPGHAGVRTTLLAAYTEKTTVLRDIIAYDEEITS